MSVNRRTVFHVIVSVTGVEPIPSLKGKSCQGTVVSMMPHNHVLGLVSTTCTRTS